MTLRMGDGPVANIPPGLDAVAGYTDNSGIGVTYGPLVARFPWLKHLSISVHGQAPAMCGDVENGALSSWRGYDYGYSFVSNIEARIAADGMPKKLWIAHQNNIPHICEAGCYPGLMHAADATQWTDHGNMWDESLCRDDFFDLTPQPVILQPKGNIMGSSSKFYRTRTAGAMPVGSIIVVQVNASNSLFVKNAGPSDALTSPPEKNQHVGDGYVQGTLDMHENSEGTGIEGVVQLAAGEIMQYINIPGTLNPDGTVVVGLEDMG
jgi:hypothetical protein